MSGAATMDEADEVCASCGIKGGGDDNITLKNCNGCFLVKYCSVKCQREHWPEHKRACKKRAAELRDELLFKQPESTDLGDCPICQLPIPIPPPTLQDGTRYTIYGCCSKVVCNGCIYANLMREREARLPPSCPFCRTQMPKSEKESHQLVMKRAEANDPEALCTLGNNRFIGGEHAFAVDCWEKAAALGHMHSHYKLSVVYHNGQGAGKNLKKATYHVEQAAIGGHVLARHNLGAWELMQNRNIDRAVKHFTIAAKLGLDLSLQTLKKCYAGGDVSKEEFAAALRAHKVAVDAMKSPQRELAARKMRGGVIYG